MALISNRYDPRPTLAKLTDGSGPYHRAKEYASSFGIDWESVLTTTSSGHMEFGDTWKEKMAEPIWDFVIPDEVVAMDVMES